MVQKNATEISAMMDAALAAQRANVAAANGAIQGLEEGIADAERLIKSMAETQEFLDSVRPTFLPFNDLLAMFPCFLGCLSGIYLSGHFSLLQVVGPTGEEAKPKLCPALEAPIAGTFSITFEAVSAASDSNQARRRLLRIAGGARASSSSVIDYNGYTLTRPDLDSLQYVDLEGAPELARWLGGSKGGTRVLGGLVLHTTRKGLDMSPSLCDKTYSHLSKQCAQKQFYDR